MNNISDYIIPAIVVLIVLHGVFKGLNVFSIFLEGAKKGFNIVLGITPALVALILAINMLQSSDALTVLCSILSPVADLMGIPNELIPLTILSPVSGSGSLVMYESILKHNLPDSFIGRCGSVMMGSTETTFCPMTVYDGSVGM